MANQAYPRSHWSLDVPGHDGYTETIDLITPAEFRTLPEGTELVCIDGKHALVGKDEIDQDVRYGFLAWGFLVPRKHDKSS